MEREIAEKLLNIGAVTIESRCSFYLVIGNYFANLL